jgi:2-oxoglutarate dehydrogenase E2 component (dihydrolipoamide succinyltransferase)
VGTVVCSIDTQANAPTKATITTNTVTETTTATKSDTTKENTNNEKSGYSNGIPSPAAKKIIDENKINATQIEASGKGGRITKADALQALKLAVPPNKVSGAREKRNEKMTMLRKKLSQRLVAVKNETAMLTTFNEVDMSAIMEIRKKYKDSFKEKYQVNLGFMSFFTKAVTEALALYPAVNASIEGDEIAYHNYCDIGIAVSAPKGLMVPVIRNAETMTLAQIEKEIIALATKARDGKLSIDEMSGGTFTITNGGVFGSMLSTPIINPPQSAILGMHNIVERPMAINGQVVIRPIMYVALSYDHRIIDGRESVGFLVKVKEMLENPVKMLTAGTDPNQILLGL